MSGLRTLRGRGPSPAGYVTCWRADCSARRSPFTGRYEPRGTHYHPDPEDRARVERLPVEETGR
jgi:hypothetical protein